MGRIAMLALGATLAASGALHAESAFDLVFRSGTLDGLPEGTEIHYAAVGMPQAGADDPWREVVVGLGPDDSALLQQQPAEGDGPARPLGSFDATVGNPVAMLFLERTVQNISESTGGSPFYIRNRIRDALAGPGRIEEVTVTWEGESISATEIALSPFMEDAHRAELGSFADLEIRVVVSEALPGWYHTMTAEAPATGTEEAYAASLSLAGVEP